jgi:tetratricopeptide (TPR) repeat protein
MKPRFTFVMIIALTMAASLAVSPCLGQNAKKLLRQGNAALRAEDFDAALDAYGRAALEAPESPYLAFNEGIVWYKKGDFGQAREHFARAVARARLLRRPDRALETRGESGLGNSWFREGQRQQDSDLKKAAEAFTESIHAYDRVLAIDPENQDALGNRKSARLLLKKILAEQAARQKAQQEQQKQQQELARRLAELAARQEDAANQSQSTAENAQTQPIAPERHAELQGNQRAISKDTDELSGQLQAMMPPAASPAPGSPPPSSASPENELLADMTQARQAQQQAQASLGQNDPGQAGPLQKQAAQHLRNALDKMKQQQDQQPGQEQQQKPGDQQSGDEQPGDQQPGEDEEQEPGGQQQGEDEEQGQQSAQPESTEGQDDDKREQQSAREADAQDAQDILDQEKTDKRRRQGNSQRGYRPVPKDW